MSSTTGRRAFASRARRCARVEREHQLTPIADATQLHACIMFCAEFFTSTIGRVARHAVRWAGRHALAILSAVQPERERSVASTTSGLADRSWGPLPALATLYPPTGR